MKVTPPDDHSAQALRLMEERDLRNEEIRKRISLSLDSQRQGKLVDGEAVFDRLEVELDARDEVVDYH